MTGTTVEATANRGVAHLRALLVAAMMIAAALAGELWRPTYRLAEHKPRIDLALQVPERFGDWRIDKSMIPVLPNPEMQAKLDTIYSQTLARTYINSMGVRVMLSIAYGSDQSSEATAVHRPEFCYSSQGFKVSDGERSTLLIDGETLPVARLVGRLGQRNEPITYWITLDESATLPGIGRKLAQIRYGLQGKIPDGMLIRVSTISDSKSESFSVQEKFLTQLHAAIPIMMRARYFGAPQAA